MVMLRVLEEISIYHTNGILIVSCYIDLEAKISTQFQETKNLSR